VVVALLLAACDGPVCDRDPPLDWDNWGEAFVSDFCLGCHSSLYAGVDRQDAPRGIDFNTYGDVLHWGDRIQARAVDAMDMPPAGGPSEEERRLLEEWLVCSVGPDEAALE
jgi:uncharacterized membrane protein